MGTDEGILVAVYSCSNCHKEYEQPDRDKIGLFNKECPHCGKDCYAHLIGVVRKKERE